MNSNTASNNHTMIFSVLVVMALSAVGVSLLHLPVMTNNVAIFAIAFVMAGLVFFQYMDLKSEGKLIYWLVVIPCVLFGILVVLFIPDVCHFSIDFLRRFF
jgi:caa(3)-type oxidase subunit IV